MSLFLTKYNVEVGGKYTDGEVRVYRQYISVLTQGNASANILNESANNTLSLTDTAVGYKVYYLSDTLGLTDAVVGEAIHAVADTLNLTDSLSSTWVHNLSVVDTLNIAQYATKPPILASAENTLVFSDYFLEDYIVEDRKIATSTLNFTQEVLTLSGIMLEQTMNLTQTAEAYNTTKYGVASDFLFLYQSMPTTHRHWIEDTLSLSDTGRVPVERTITQTLNLVDVASMSDLADALSFVQVVTVGKSKTASSTLNLNDTVAVQGLFVREVVDDLGIGHAFTWVEDSPCNRKSYSPFYGENTIPGAVAPPPVALPVSQGSLERFLLYSPATGPRSSEVSLRAPEMDNRDRNAYSRVARETRGGKLYVFADPIWPKVRGMVVTVVGLLKSDVEAMQTFMQTTIGQEVGVMDWEGRQWVGVITNPDEPATQDGVDRWTVTFTLEGELLESYNPGTGNDSALNLTDSATYTVV